MFIKPNRTVGNNVRVTLKYLLLRSDYRVTQFQYQVTQQVKKSCTSISEPVPPKKMFKKLLSSVSAAALGHGAHGEDEEEEEAEDAEAPEGFSGADLDLGSAELWRVLVDGNAEDAEAVLTDHLIILFFIYTR